MRKASGRGNENWKAVCVRVLGMFTAAACCVCVAAHIEKSAVFRAQKVEGGQGQKQIQEPEEEPGEAIEVSTDGNYIKWVDFNVTSDAMAAAYELDVNTYKEDLHLDWIELLAYVGAMQGGRFDKGSPARIRQTAEKLKNGETTLEELTKELKYYSYYKEAYGAVLGDMVGEFSLEVDAQNGTGETASVSGNASADGKTWKKFYGLKAFLPIAKGFEYSHYDDFGSSRSYGYARPHLGHDMMGQIGTPTGMKYRTVISESNM